MQLIAYLIAILGTLAIGAGSIVALEIARPGGDWNSNTTTIIIGLCTMIVTQLLGLMKSVNNGKVAEEIKKDVKEIAATTKAP